jgi:hypothetical protein
MTNFPLDLAALYRVSEKCGINGNFIYYLLFTLYAIYVHPDTLRIFSATFKL